MTNEKLLGALHEKMSAEQDKFREWLLAQFPEEILNLTFEYSTREDIVLLMDQVSITNEQLRTLLASPTPLGDVYKAFSNMDTSMVETIQACMEESANAIQRAEQHNRQMVPKKKSVLSKLHDKAARPLKPHTPKKGDDAR